jgi:hypothetical protein
MPESDTDIKRWTGRRKAAAVLDVIKGKSTGCRISGPASGCQADCGTPARNERQWLFYSFR